MAFTIEELQNQLSQQRQQIGQRYAQAAQLVGQQQAPDQVIQGLRAQETDKVKQLWEADKRMAERYANPQSEVYMEDPYQRERARAMQAQATVGELGGIQNLIAQRKDATEQALERGLRLLEYGIRASQAEADIVQAQLSAALREQEMKEKSVGTSDKSAVLQQLFNAITGFQQKQEAVMPEETYITKNKGEYKPFLKPELRGPLNKEIAAFKEKHKGKVVEYKKNPDGTYTLTVHKEGQQALTPEEVPAYSRPEETLRKMLAGTIAAEPDVDVEATKMFQQLVPEPPKPKSQTEKKQEKFVQLRQDLAAIPQGSSYEEALNRFLLAYPELSAVEITKELDAMVGPKQLNINQY